MLKKLLFVMLSMALLTVLFAACTIKDQANAPAGPTVKMTPSNFTVPTITIKKGETLILDNNSTQTHFILNGTWDGATQKPASEAGAPKVSANMSAGVTQSVGPFNTAGSFKYYCSIHQGMNLTVTVA